MELTLSDAGALAIQIAMGISLAACAGLRAFLPLFVVGAAGRFDVIPLSSTFEWLASTPSLSVLAVAVVAEVLADKIPVVDNLLDTVQGFVKPIAGAVLMVSVLTELSPLQATVLGLIAGGSVAGAVHVTKAKTRLVSSVTTAGLGNPLLSFAEDTGVLVGSLAAIVVPLFVLLAVAIGFVLVWLVFRRTLRSTRTANP